MEELRQKISTFLTSRVNDRELVNDLTQETLLRLLKSKKDDSIQNEEAWSIRIAKNLMIDHYRRSARKPEEAGEAVEYDDLTDEIIKCQTLFIKELDIQAQFLINEVDLKGRPQKELAIEMEIPYPSLRSKVQRARKQIRKRFEETCEFEYDSAGRILCCWERPSSACK